MLPLETLLPRAITRKETPVLTFHCEMDLALTYALRRPKLALECAFRALKAAVAIGNPALSYRANELIGALS